MTDITPARLRELADTLAPEVNDIFVKEERVQVAAALRAAAEEIENHTPTQHAYDAVCAALGRHKARADKAEATLAAREALLKRAKDVLDDHLLHRRLALAAEIAAALEENDNDPRSE